MKKDLEELGKLPKVCKVERSEACYKQFQRDFSKGLFSQDDGIVIKAWIIEMERLGPDYIQTSNDWNDHPLYYNWAGYRASCFSKKGRIIYKIVKGKIAIARIEKITPNHEYKGGPK